MRRPTVDERRRVWVYKWVRRDERKNGSEGGEVAEMAEKTSPAPSQSEEVRIGVWTCTKSCSW